MKRHMYAANGAKASLVVAIAAGILIALSPAHAEENDSDTYRFLQLFGGILERVRADYVEEKSDQELIEAAIQGMLRSLDPHSSYLNKKNYGDMQVQTKGEFGGLGIEITLENGFVKVVSPIDDTPAYRAGLKTGDLITHLDGASIQGMALAEAVEKMRGKVDTDIVLKIRREGREPFDVTITRAIVRITPVRSRAEGKVGYLRITAFSEQAETAAEEAIKKLREEIGQDQILGLVLDLRNNPGGLLDQAVSVTDLFLEEGEIVSTRGRDPDSAQRFNARAGDATGGLPIVILINGGSASASEIVAGALQDHQRAILMGTRSFGKGSVQTIIPQGGQVAIRLTTALYYTPSGRSIQATGIEPDIIIEQGRLERTDQGATRREKDLRGALDGGAETGDDRPAGEDTDDAEPEKQEDYQLSRALDLLRGISLFRGQTVN